MENGVYLKMCSPIKIRLSNKKMLITILPNKKPASTKIFLAKKFHGIFLIATSPNWQDSYTTYPKISAN